MIGKNVLRLNEATMMAAVQHYFDSVLYAPGKSPKISAIETTGDRPIGVNLFQVTVDEAEPK
jgi:hypothetical protein